MINRLFFIFVFIFIFWPQISFAAIAKQATDYDDSSSGDNTETTSVTVDSGSDLMVFASGAEDPVEADMTISGISCNSSGFTLTKAVGYTESVNRVEIWYAIAPTVGTYDCITSLGGTTTSIRFNYTMFSGVNQLGQPGAIGSGTTGGFMPSSAAVTTIAPNSVVIDVVDVNASAVTNVIPTAGQTEVLDSDDDSHTVGVGFEIETTAGTYTQTWSADSGSGYDAVAVSFAPAATANQVIIIGGSE